MRADFSPLPDADAVKAAMAGRGVAFYGQFTHLKKVGAEWRGPCPLHGGDGPNFVVYSEGNWHCHSQCQDGGDAIDFLCRKEHMDFPEALETLAGYAGITTPAAPSRNGHTSNGNGQSGGKGMKPARRVVDTYSYPDESETLLYQSLRYEPKDFRQRRPDAVQPGQWIYNLGDVRRVLYRLPDVLVAVKAGKAVYVCEGEKDSDRLHSLGLCGTTNAMGAGNWREEYADSLSGANVVILPDNDEPGRKHAQKVAAALHGKAARVRIVELPGLPDKGDVSDWLDAGGTKDALFGLVEAAPDYASSIGEGLIGCIKIQEPPATGSSSRTAPANWPEPLNSAAFHGLAGDIVQAISPHTEADDAALLFQFLAAFGNAINRNAHFTAEADRHYGNLFVCLVGNTAKGRKGTSWGHIRTLFQRAEPIWTEQRVLSGLTSGEGMIWAVRDPIEKQQVDKKTKRIETITEDEGVSDKRLLAFQSEFASVLHQFARDGNTLSALIREAWDTGRLQTLTKNSPAKATDAHISIIAHITRDELRRYLTDTEAANGLANRFLWACVRRSKELPEGGALTDAALSPFISRLQGVLQHGRATSLLRRDDDARVMWRAVYHDLSEGKPGLFGAVTSRAEAQVMRLALLYALLDGANVIEAAHLRAGLAVWEYCEDSCRYIFGDATGDPVADTILSHLRANPEGLSQTDISNLFKRNQSAERLTQALALLAELGRIQHERRETGGRPSDVWRAK